ncbi:hypothetical protein L6R21_18570 [bacterium]|nr:hypothetical protein [bacterium]
MEALLQLLQQTQNMLTLALILQRQYLFRHFCLAAAHEPTCLSRKNFSAPAAIGKDESGMAGLNGFEHGQAKRLILRGDNLDIKCGNKRIDLQGVTFQTKRHMQRSCLRCDLILQRPFTHQHHVNGTMLRHKRSNSQQTINALE